MHQIVPVLKRDIAFVFSDEITAGHVAVKVLRHAEQPVTLVVHALSALYRYYPCLAVEIAHNALGELIINDIGISVVKQPLLSLVQPAGHGVLPAFHAVLYEHFLHLWDKICRYCVLCGVEHVLLPVACRDITQYLLIYAAYHIAGFLALI